jgi:serine/threonine protein kinase
MQPLIDLQAGRTKMIGTIFQVTERIGIGHFAQVYKAYNEIKRTDLAIKIYNKYDENTYSIAKSEISLLQKLEDLKTDYFPVPNGGLRKQKLNNKNYPFFAMELCEYTFEDGEKPQKIIRLNDLFVTGAVGHIPKIQLPEFWKKNTVLEFIKCLCDAVHMLHKNNIIHRDLKPSNILIKKPSGERYIKPFIIDFNTSMTSGIQVSSGGTDSYLPPEVRSGRREKADEADDLWAIAKIISELIFGKDEKIAEGVQKHRLIDFAIPNEFVKIVIKALAPNPEERFMDASNLKDAFDEIISNMIKNGDDSEGYLTLTSDEIIWIRENKTKILLDLISSSCAENELPVLKETKDRVSSVYSSLYQDFTQSFDLKEEIIRLGVDAIPSIIEQGYKLIPNSNEFHIILDALAFIANQKMDLAKRAIELYCVSSDYSVRRMCQILCDNIQYFPTNLIDSIVEDDLLFLPEERVNIADICIKWSTDKNVMMPLNMYMCKEYILDTERYYELKDTIASRISELKFEEKAGLIVGDTKMRVWEELKEYENLDPDFQKKVDVGLKELFADAFSSLEEEAFAYLCTNGLPSFSDDIRRLPIASTFVAKLAKRYEPARRWLFDELSRYPMKDLYFAAQKLGSGLSENEKSIWSKAAKRLNIENIENDNVDVIFQRYLTSGNMQLQYRLCNEEREYVLMLIENQIAQEIDSQKICYILELLYAYKNRNRGTVVPIVLEHWDKFSKTDYNLSAHVLADYVMPTEGLEKNAIMVLERDLSVAEKKDHATESIEKLLKKRA